MPNLGQTKTRLLATGALMVGGTLVGGALGGAAGGILVAGALGNLAASVAGGIFSNDLGDIVKGLGEDEEILNDRELTQAVGLAIALVIYSVAKDKRYSAHKAALERLAKRSVKDWQTIAVATEGDKDYVGVHQEQLIDVFSTNPAEFAKVTALDIPTWEHALGWLSNQARVQLPEDVIEYVAGKLHITFPKALREVLKHDASKGGQAFSEMLLLLLGKITAALKQSNTQYADIVKRLESVATTQQVCAVMARVESGIRGELAEIKQVLQTIAVSQVRQLPVPDDFRWIIEDKTTGFVGREFVFDAIEELFQQCKGYFIIEGDPGMGKSSILAEFVRRNDCIVYFNQRNEGITSAEQFLRSVCIQLIEGYELSHSKDIQPENTRNSNFLSQLLNEVSGTLKSGERLVIAVDALDEVDLSSQSAGANVLYLPGVLPDGIYFIVTKRPLLPDQLPLQVKDKRLFDLMQYPARNQEDVEAYIRQRLTSVGATHVSPLQEWVKSRGADEEEFVSTLVEKSEGNFMYLRYVLDDIEKGAYPDLEIRDLPSDLQDYYYKHWERMGMNAKPLFKIKIVYILSESPVPIPFEEIVAILEADGEEERGLAVKVQAILDEWMQFLREEEKYGQTFYSVYHSSFRDFLRNERTVKRSGITLQGIIEMMANSM
ncbi:ATP-binding protein [Microcoleus sp. FACHB-53]|nr:ATP-binding protein [Microcoleus sp. FACHB-53]